MFTYCYNVIIANSELLGSDPEFLDEKTREKIEEEDRGATAQQGADSMHVEEPAEQAAEATAAVDAQAATQAGPQAVARTGAKAKASANAQAGALTSAKAGGAKTGAQAGTLTSAKAGAKAGKKTGAQAGAKASAGFSGFRCFWISRHYHSHISLQVCQYGVFQIPYFPFLCR